MNFFRSLFLIGLLSGLFTTNAHAQTYAVSDFIDSLDLPIAFEFAPDGRVFLTQKGTYNTPVSNAEIRVYDANGNFIQTFYDLSDSVFTNGECGLLGLALDPDFTNNHFVYAYYIHAWNLDTAFRVIRFTDVNSIGTNPTVIFNHPATTHLSAHVAGNIHFRNSEPNNLYIVIGELNNPSHAQQLDRPYGKVLRITKTGGIPTDNPFYDDGNPYTGNDDRIYSYGHRNPFDFCFSPITDSLYISENGELTWDEIDLGIKGLNYGWPYCEGGFVTGSTTQGCNVTLFTDPIADYNPTVGFTGITYYHSSTMPQLDNHLLVGDFNHHDIHDYTLNPPDYTTISGHSIWMPFVAYSGISALHQGPDGCVYAGVLGFYPNGKIIKICPSNLGEAETLNTISNIVLTPQPFTEETTLRYTLNESNQVTISLVDVSGKQLAVLFDGKNERGTQELRIPATAVPSAGIYYLMIQTETTVQVLKLVRI